jgi:hypothetical protein
MASDGKAAPRVGAEDGAPSRRSPRRIGFPGDRSGSLRTPSPQPSRSRGDRCLPTSSAQFGRWTLGQFSPSPWSPRCARPDMGPLERPRGATGKGPFGMSFARISTARLWHEAACSTLRGPRWLITPPEHPRGLGSRPREARNPPSVIERPAGPHAGQAPPSQLRLVSCLALLIRGADGPPTVPGGP